MQKRPPSVIDTANPGKPTIVTDPTVRACTDSSIVPAISRPTPMLRSHRQRVQETRRRPASQQESIDHARSVLRAGPVPWLCKDQHGALHQADGRTVKRYNRRDTPTWLYRPLGLHDRMPCMGISAKAQSHAAPSTEKIRRQTPSRRRSESRQRTALVAVRLLPRERDMLSETARSRGVSLSEFIRSSAMSIASDLGSSGEGG